MRHFKTASILLTLGLASTSGCLDDGETLTDADGAAATTGAERPFVAGPNRAASDHTMPGADIVAPFSGNWNYSWGDTKNSAVDIGTATNRTCFMTGISGDLRPGDDRYFADGFHPVGGGVRVKANGNYELYVNTTRATQIWARCVNSSVGRTTEVTWQSGTPAVNLGAITAGRRCFLTQIDNHNWVYNGDKSTGWYAFTNLSSDYVKIWHDNANWYLGGSVAKGNVFAKAQCFTVSEDDGVWGWQAGDPGTRKDLLTNVGGATCGLTGFGGHFDKSDWNDGAFISYEAGINQFYMNTKNGKFGETQCMK
jgi:hypothetical protein